MISDDTDGVFTSATRPLSAAERQLAVDEKGIAQRLKLAEDALDLLMYNDDIWYFNQGIVDALVSWENARGERFVFTNDVEHVIATGLGGLEKWLEEQGSRGDDEDKADWRQQHLEERLSIWCDAEGIPSEIEAPGNQRVERTIQGWLACVKQNGLLCVQGD